MGGTVKRVCTVCARGGSKGLPNKNMRLLAGKPMLAWTIEQANASGLFEAVVVSSDSVEILQTATIAGAAAAIERPAELAIDSARKEPAIRHAVLEAEHRFGGPYDIVVDLDVTAPLRLVGDIVGAVALLETSGVSNVITGTPAHRSPYFNLVERSPNGSVHVSKKLAQSVHRRQDAPPCFDMNASIYGWRRDAFIADPRVFYSDTVIYEMPEERSRDVDSELDFVIVEFLFQRLQIANRLDVV
jgi:N-acylneuraminate cytidylyltransferase/CMP-N,N'-diacetyllegionaminic acid synthase